MRDLIVVLIVFGSIPLIFIRPYIGILIWCWVAYMTPHKLGWGFASQMPLAQVIAIVTIAAIFFSAEKRKFPLSREVVVNILFIMLMAFTTLWALEPEEAELQLLKILKIQILIFMTLYLINTEGRLNALVWAIALSIGFFGVKGGIFTILGGGTSHVLGAEGSFTGDNNQIGMALVMVLPLIRYLHLQADKRWLKMGLLGAMILTAVAILGTQSRGAFVALTAVMFVLVLKSDRKMIFFLVALLIIPALLSIMPDQWWDRMGSISEYEEDGSAMGRINAWGFAYNVALDRPFIGGGFECFKLQWFIMYAPNPTDVHDAHSIYFEVLGEHGFIGLLLFLLIGLLSLLKAQKIIKITKNIDELGWANCMARMVQVSIVGFAVNGLFIGLAYFFFFYHLVTIIVVLDVLVKRKLETLDLADGDNPVNDGASGRLIKTRMVAQS